VTHHVSHVTLLSFTNPLLWPYWIVKCPSYAHFRISPVIWVLFAYFSTSTVNLASFVTLFFTYYLVGKYVILNAATVFLMA